MWVPTDVVIGGHMGPPLPELHVYAAGPRTRRTGNRERACMQQIAGVTFVYEQVWSYISAKKDVRPCRCERWSIRVGAEHPHYLLSNPPWENKVEPRLVCLMLLDRKSVV
jgi:hypothetical protein